MTNAARSAILYSFSEHSFFYGKRETNPKGRKEKSSRTNVRVYYTMVMVTRGVTIDEKNRRKRSLFLVFSVGSSDLRTESSPFVKTHLRSFCHLPREGKVKRSAQIEALSATVAGTLRLTASPTGDAGFPRIIGQRRTGTAEERKRVGTEERRKKSK